MRRFPSYAPEVTKDIERFSKVVLATYILILGGRLTDKRENLVFALKALSIDRKIDEALTEMRNASKRVHATVIVEPHDHAEFKRAQADFDKADKRLGRLQLQYDELHGAA